MDDYSEHRLLEDASGETAADGPETVTAVQGASEDATIIEGHLATAAALRSGNREVFAVFIREDKHDRIAAGVARLADRADAPVRRVPDEEMDRLTTGRTHGGIAALVGSRRFLSPDELAAAAGASSLVMLDGIEDPYNFGSCVRSLYAAGIDGLVLRTRNWMSAASTVAKASAGASELIPTATIDTAPEAAEFFRQCGYRIACAAASPQAVSLPNADFSGKTFLLIGGEKRGITRSFLDSADLIVQIPYGRETDIALDTASATAVIAFEIQRQRAKTAGPEARSTGASPAQPAARATQSSLAQTERGRRLLQSGRRK
jgi:23S rRNA (guanosine2251-2'-O)-methyltransferase